MDNNLRTLVEQFHRTVFCHVEHTLECRNSSRCLVVFNSTYWSESSILFALIMGLQASISYKIKFLALAVPLSGS